VDLPVLQQAGFMVYFPKLQRNKLNIAGNGFEISLESHYLQHATNPVHMKIIPSKHHKAIVYYTILLLVLVAFACSHPKTIEAETHPLSDDTCALFLTEKTACTITSRNNFFFFFKMWYCQYFINKLYNNN
jgi:hypothetical protein